MIAIKIENGRFMQVALSDDGAAWTRIMRKYVGTTPTRNNLPGDRVEWTGKGVTLITGRNRSGLTRDQVNRTEREWRHRNSV